MQKTKTYYRTKFDVTTIKRGISMLDEISERESEYDDKYLTVTFEDTRWNHDNIGEYFADYRENFKRSNLKIRFEDYKLAIRTITSFDYLAEIEVEAPSRAEIEIIMSIFDDTAKEFYEPLPPVEEEPMPKRFNPKIFIGHGGNEQWKILKDHLHEQHGYDIEAYETGARAGHTIRDILDDMMEESSFALLVYTGEDETKDGEFRARQNVIHETGLFQGKLGYNKAIVLLEEGTEEFSNLAGIQQLRFPKGQIKTTFGDVLATIKREFE